MYLKVLILAVALSACEIKDMTSEEQSTSPASYDSAALVGSPKAAVKKRRVNQMQRSLSKILGMTKNQLCLELGKIPCGDLVHKVSLGGMDAYSNSQYEYASREPVTAPMAVDRLVLASCSTRASLDIVNPAQGVIFRDINLTDDGRLSKDQAFYDSINRLYQRAFLRNPTATEVKAMEDLYVEIYEENPIGAARNWAVLSCYVVLSSIEFLFY
ncbi:hypothetical protein [Pseudobacteriovorax antillogorgiicola]|uniref:Uncharacterized protein n=1 Tax=Pseudobacteriovorax antillogorgiicola TaxID=1513793 RepID=A0A1Y6BN65_9BACT|nr:hypothetical protein [Pseudobacteriovorax antillogorgiicola]TCS54565.1 hypothetical protein EDD56_10678 [Pseudobacteriovorax antillogorgiicola]SMF18222.1 hypothetical protein SAMN06296036_106165 [Pseudobacteriovorax antillogorgiicola]